MAASSSSGIRSRFAFPDMRERQISVIIPTLNERGSIELLIRRMDDFLSRRQYVWEAVVIDDRSIDGTFEKLERLKGEGLPIRFFRKVGQRGKAYSLLEGFRQARFENIAILDADLQCPPEAIGPMLDELLAGADIVVANRRNAVGSISRRLASWIFQEFFVYRLNGIKVDSQSGLKVFRRSILESITLNPSPWTFDMEFLLKAELAGYVMRGYPVDFSERTSGESKLSFWSASVEIAWNAVSLWYQYRLPIAARMFGTGFSEKIRRFSGTIARRRSL
ncbi:MAG: glycosyltransferase family 2 protein [Candidatus Moraniibacteriota bacterium]|nr:MAG: glycosyltransferase family 2 protein [Candidatus Moranbacteria bacterium]